MRGGHVPAKGKLLLFQAIAPNGQWRTFDQIRSERNGRWHYRYEFTETRGLQHYRLRRDFESHCTRRVRAGLRRKVPRAALS